MRGESDPAQICGKPQAREVGAEVTQARLVLCV